MTVHIYIYKVEFYLPKYASYVKFDKINVNLKFSSKQFR